MTNRPIFVATHPRACSTAFERVFITRRDILECHHEPFGDPFYFGPENLSPRFKDDEAGRVESGYADLTFGDVMDQLLNQKEGKRVFTKDMAYYLFSPQGRPTSLFPSLVDRLPGGKSKEAVEVEVKENGSGTSNGVRKLLQEPGNPTAVPREMLRKFHFAFLIRHPRRSVPSYYRCHIPPLVDVTGFSEFLPEESGYAELRRLFDFLRSESMVGPGRAGEAATNGTTNGVNGTANGVNGTNGTNGTNGVNGHAEQERVPITLVDADDLLDRPEEVVRAFCRDVGIDYKPVMLDWDEESLAQSSEAFKKWDGFHDDALGSTSLKPRTHAQKTKTEEQEDEEWRQKFGDEAAKVIRQTVNDNIEHYEYLKQFKLKI